MNWEQTILYIRDKAEYKDLVEKTYLEENLIINVDRFIQSEEFAESLLLLKHYAPKAKRILDVGSGNGISALAFALNGFDVTVSEPDKSDTIGTGAIKKLKDHFNISNLAIYEEFAENLWLETQFDVVYVRQAMHHAFDLPKFIENLAKLVKPGGILFTVRDHVIYNEEDKRWFLECHPLHRFYGGENAFRAQEYRDAITNAGLILKSELKHFDSVINYFPLTKNDFDNTLKKKEREIEAKLFRRVGPFAKLSLFKNLYKRKIKFDVNKIFDEAKVPGRMYSFIALKP